MAVGDNYQTSVKSYVAAFKETTFGTYPASAATNASAIEFISCGFQTTIDSQKLESFGLTRGYNKRVQLNKNVGGALESYLHPHESPLLFAVAMGGGITSAGTTTAGYTHSLTAGDFDTSPSSLSFNVKKGDTVFGYTGGRVNALKISAKINEPVMVSAEFIFKDSTVGATDIASSLSISSVLPFTFAQGVYRYQATESAAATTTAAEPIQEFELTINNGLIADDAARQLGSNLLQILPPTRRSIDFKIVARFDTTTTYNRFIQGTAGSAELIFTGATVITSTSNYMCTIRLPKLYYNTSDPLLESPEDILQAEIAFDVTTDTGTSAGRDIGITFFNDIATY
jgi:hypothetical protein